LAQRRGDADREGQEARHADRQAEQCGERVAARILEHKYAAIAAALQVNRLDRPGAVELLLPTKLVSETIAGRRRWMLRNGQQRQNCGRGGVDAHDSPAEYAVAILP